MLEGDLRYSSLTGNWATSTLASTWTADGALVLRGSTRPVKEQEAALIDVLCELLEVCGEGPA